MLTTQADGAARGREVLRPKCYHTRGAMPKSPSKHAAARPQQLDASLAQHPGVGLAQAARLRTREYGGNCGRLLLQDGVGILEEEGGEDAYVCVCAVCVQGGWGADAVGGPTGLAATGSTRRRRGRQQRGQQQERHACRMRPSPCSALLTTSRKVTCARGGWGGQACRAVARLARAALASAGGRAGGAAANPGWLGHAPPALTCSVHARMARQASLHCLRSSPKAPSAPRGGAGPPLRPRSPRRTARKPCSSVPGRMPPSTAITNSRPIALKQKP